MALPKDKRHGFEYSPTDENWITHTSVGLNFGICRYCGLFYHTFTTDNTRDFKQQVKEQHVQSHDHLVKQESHRNKNRHGQ